MQLSRGTFFTIWCSEQQNNIKWSIVDAVLMVLTKPCYSFNLKVCHNL